MRKTNAFVPVMYKILIVNSNHWLGISVLKPAVGVCLPACPKQGLPGKMLSRRLIICTWICYSCIYGVPHSLYFNGREIVNQLMTSKIMSVFFYVSI